MADLGLGKFVLGVDVSASQNVFFLAEAETGEIVYSKKYGQGAFYNFGKASEAEVARRRQAGQLLADFALPPDVQDDVRTIDLEYLDLPRERRASAFLRDKAVEFLDEARTRLPFQDEDIVGAGFSVAGKVFRTGESDGVVRMLGGNTPSRFGSDIGGGQMAIDVSSGIHELLQNARKRGGNDCNTIGKAISLVYGAQGINPNKTFYITVSTGIGGGGPLDMCDEVGHHTVRGVHPSVQVHCGCGKMNCVEAYASGTGLPNYARKVMDLFTSPDFIGFTKHEADIGYPGLMEAVRDSTLWQAHQARRDSQPLLPISSIDVFDAMRNGDKFATYLVDRSAKMVADLVVDLGMDYDLQVVGIGGGVGQNEPDFIRKVQEQVNKTLEGCALLRSVKVEANPLGKAANAYGALAPVIPEQYAANWAQTMLEAARKVREGDRATLELLQLDAPPAAQQQRAVQQGGIIRSK